MADIADQANQRLGPAGGTRNKDSASIQWERICWFSLVAPNPKRQTQRLAGSFESQAGSLELAFR